MTVLIIEPGRVYQQLLAHMLNTHSIPYQIVVDGKAGLMHRGDIDLICTARQLPDMLGTEFCRRYRNQNASPAIPILMWSADVSRDIKNEARQYGINGVFERNNANELFVAILQHLDGSKSETVRKVLLIEDSVTMAMIMRAQLEKAGLHVQHFTNGEQATTALLEGQYDLVLTDIILDGKMNGMDVLKFVRQQTEPLNQLPVLAATGLEDQPFLEQMWDAGLDGFVKKPLDMNEFGELVARLLVKK